MKASFPYTNTVGRFHWTYESRIVPKDRRIGKLESMNGSQRDITGEGMVRKWGAYTLVLTQTLISHNLIQFRFTSDSRSSPGKQCIISGAPWQQEYVLVILTLVIMTTYPRVLSYGY